MIGLAYIDVRFLSSHVDRLWVEPLKSKFFAVLFKYGAYPAAGDGKGTLICR